MTITIIGFVSLIAVFIGGTWKLMNKLHTIDKELRNDMRHKIERIEDKIDKLADRINELHNK